MRDEFNDFKHNNAMTIHELNERIDKVSKAQRNWQIALVVILAVMIARGIAGF